MIQRNLEPKILDIAQQVPVVTIFGPRHAGKTTIARKLFKEHRYISLEEYDMREEAQRDPRGFLAKYPTKMGIILDEIEYASQLLSYIQGIVDQEKRSGRFIIIGSQTSLMSELTQIFAEKIAFVRLLPLSINELEQAKLLPHNIETAVFQGSYPRAYFDQIHPTTLYKNYVDTYLERDVRNIQQIVSLSNFQKFVQICAGRTGQLLNISALSLDAGIDQKTAKSRLSILEATDIIFLLPSYFKNFKKRLIQTPKLYFVDTGMACSLLGLHKPSDLMHYYARTNLIETYIMSDLLKQFYNLDQQPSLYFWRDQKGEIDCIIDQAGKATSVEIKASSTINQNFFTNVAYWEKVTKSETSSYLIYTGSLTTQWSHTQIISWKSAGNLIKEIEKP